MVLVVFDCDSKRWLTEHRVFMKTLRRRRSAEKENKLHLVHENLKQTMPETNPMECVFSMEPH